MNRRFSFWQTCRLAVALRAAALCSTFTCVTAAQAAQYVVTDLGTLGGNQSEVRDVNVSGQAVGLSYATGNAVRRAFLWKPSTPNGISGAMHDLGTLGGNESVGNGINDSGQTVGWARPTGNPTTHAFLWTPSTPNGVSGAMHDLGTLGGTASTGLDVNASGQVVGDSSTTGNATTHAFLWTPSTPNGDSGAMHDLGTLGGSGSSAAGINDSGQVVGESTTAGDLVAHAFLWTSSTPNDNSGAMHDLGTLGGAYSSAFGLNASGQAVGWSYTTDDASTHAFLWTPSTPNGNSGVMHDLGTLGGAYSAGWDVNDSGQVVGSSYYTTGSAVAHAFLWTSGAGMVDLNTLIDPLSGWELETASAINDAGQIVGSGRIGGQNRAFLLTPIPEPSSLALLASALPLATSRFRPRVAAVL